LLLLKQLVIDVHRSQKLDLMIEDHTANQIRLAKVGDKPVHTLTNVSPLLAMHGPTDIQIKQDCIVLDTELQEGVYLFMDE